MKFDDPNANATDAKKEKEASPLKPEDSVSQVPATLAEETQKPESESD